MTTTDVRPSSGIAGIFYLMRAGDWFTLADISTVVGLGESSVSAHLRNLRKQSFGGYQVDRRHITHGLYEYRLVTDPSATPAWEKK